VFSLPQVFYQGECTANDKPEGARGAINQNKTCFSCFRIPTVLAGQTPGVLHAFAEARRGELTGGFHAYTGSGDTSCPDGPDTRLAYTRLPACTFLKYIPSLSLLK